MSVLTKAAVAVGFATTVNVTALLVPPPGVVTVMFRSPKGAVGRMLKVAVIWVAVTATPVAVMPAPGFTVAPVKLAPVRVTGALEPAAASAGTMVASVGTRDEEQAVMLKRLLAAFGSAMNRGTIQAEAKLPLMAVKAGGAGAKLRLTVAAPRAGKF